MPIYPYIAEDVEGGRHEGAVQASTRTHAVKALRESGWRPVQVDLPTAPCDHRVPDVQAMPR
jgi:type II secretory pathway component PulF